MIILQGITVEELLTQIEAIVDSKLKELSTKEKEPAYRYLTRKEVSKLLNITLPTLHDWTKQGYLKSYKLGSRVLYRSNEVDEDITATKYKKYR